MTFEYIKTILSRCEQLSDFNISTDRLKSSKNSISIVPTDSYKLIKSYSDGDRIIGFEFGIMVRLALDSDDNTRNYDILDSIVTWISHFEPQDGDEICENGVSCSPLGIELISGPVLADDNIHSGKYKMECRLDCIYRQNI